MIGECASSWRFGPTSQHLDNAYRMIAAAKECDASAAKFQWTSDPVEMSQRRNDFIPAHYEILAYPFDWLEKLKAKCDEVGISFMCTIFLYKDLNKIAPLVSAFKVASAESSDEDFVDAHLDYRPMKEVYVSYAFGARRDPLRKYPRPQMSALHCVCSYPTNIAQLNLGRTRLFHGLSDHTTSMLTGALAVAVGATVIEKHIRLLDTPDSNSDYPHSLLVGAECYQHRECGGCFRDYVANIREAELAMGNGENVMQECEKGNVGRRVGVKH